MIALPVAVAATTIESAIANDPLVTVGERICVHPFKITLADELFTFTKYNFTPTNVTTPAPEILIPLEH